MKIHRLLPASLLLFFCWAWNPFSDAQAADPEIAPYANAPGWAETKEDRMAWFKEALYKVLPMYPVYLLPMFPVQTESKSDLCVTVRAIKKTDHINRSSSFLCQSGGYAIKMRRITKVEVPNRRISPIVAGSGMTSMRASQSFAAVFSPFSFL